MNGPSADGWQDLARQATLALTVPTGDVARPRLGSGFFVAPGIVVTCAHVLAEAGATLPARIEGHLVASGRMVSLESDREWYYRDASGLDLAFLRVVAAAGESLAEEPMPVLMSPAMRLGDVMWTFGHPDSAFRAGQSATFTFQGVSRRSPGHVVELPRVHGVPVGPGFSGSPVVNQQTGAVCGMLSTSDERGSAHLIPVTEITACWPGAGHLDASASSHHDWLSLLTDDQIKVGGWQFPGPDLRAYLDAAVRSAEGHPYPGLVPGTRPPPLAAVYLRQTAFLRAGTSQQPAAAGREAPAVSAEAVMEQERDCLVIAGPGAGKSSLLRLGLINAARRWREGAAGAEIPVRILAADLVAARPLPEAIAAAVKADLSTVGLLRAWPPEFFAAQPLRDVRWLVLVDGLDEVADPKARSAVLTKIVSIAESPHPPPYRFVIVTRPLPEQELRWPGWAVQRYELQPFTGEQLKRFAEGWFTVLPLPDPEAGVAAFLASLKQTRLAELAGLPLMATMLCQLYAQDPGNPLPAGRAETYRRFVDLLKERQRDAGISLHLRAALEDWPGALSAAAELLTALPDLLARLAAGRLNGDTRPTLALLISWSPAARPATLPDAIWTQLLRELLRRSGLMVERSDDFTFIHQTLAEYLAARHAAVDAEAAREAYNRLFQWPPRSRTDRWDGLVWRPQLDYSYGRFLIAAWLSAETLPRPARRLPRALNGLATKAGLKGCRFIISLIKEGTPLPADIITGLRDTLVGLATVPDAHRPPYDGESGWGFYSGAPDAAALLAGLGDARGTELLVGMIGGHTHLAPGRQFRVDRIAAARMLAELGDQQGTEFLGVTAACPQCPARDRHKAAVALAITGDPRAAGILAAMLADPQPEIDYWDHISAARALAGRDDPHGRDMLIAIATDPSIKSLHRRSAAEKLAELGDPHITAVLTGLATDPAVEFEAGEWAIHLLTRMDPEHAAEVQHTVAANARTSGFVRIRAARVLADMGDPRGADLLAAIAGADKLVVRDMDSSARYDAAKVLADRGDPRAPDLLAAIATDESRIGIAGAAMALADLGDPRGRERLAAIATDASVPAYFRLQAAEALAERNDPQAPELLAAIATDRSVTRDIRRDARKALALCERRRRP